MPICSFQQIWIYIGSGEISRRRKKHHVDIRFGMICRRRVLDRMFWDRINRINGICLVVAAVYYHLRDKMIRQEQFAFHRPPVTCYSLQAAPLPDGGCRQPYLAKSLTAKSILEPQPSAGAGVRTQAAGRPRGRLPRQPAG